MHRTVDDPVYKRVVKTFSQTGLDKIFPDFKGCLKRCIKDAYKTSLDTWRGGLYGEKFMRYTTRVAVENYLEEKTEIHNPLLVKDMVRKPKHFQAEQKGDSVMLSGAVLADFQSSELPLMTSSIPYNTITKLRPTTA